MPPQIIPKGIATPSLLAQVITAKFLDAMPFYRQTKQFARLGVDISRHFMSGWAMAVAKALEPLHELFHAEIRSGHFYQHGRNHLASPKGTYNPTPRRRTCGFSVAAI
jgi:transposase